MTHLKIGIIGVGGIAEGRHIPAILNEPNTAELYAISDLSETRVKEVAEKYNIPHASTDYQDILGFVDAIIVCTPNKFHKDITVAALEAGCHVMCEKPMAMNTTECETMIATAEKHGKLLTIAYHYRHTDAAQLAKQTMKSGDIGEALVTRVQALRQRKVPGWGVFTNKDLQGGGSLIDYGCHLLDMALWLLDNPEPIEVIGRTYNQLSKTPGQINEWGLFNAETFDVDDHVTSYITFENGASLMLETSWAANIKADQMSLSISGVDGGISVYPYEVYHPSHGKMMTTTTSATHDEDVAGERQMHNFIQSCLGHASLLVQPEQALRVNRVIEAIYESSQTGKSVILSQNN